MVRVGLVGEDPNDTSSIKNLLDKKYKGRVKFYSLARSVKGYQLDNPKIRKSLPIEVADKKCKLVIFIRDLDAFGSETAKVKAKQKWFKDLSAVLNKDSVLLLNIWELEALILGDIDSFNTIYHTAQRFPGDPMLQKEPKEFLKRITSHSRKQFKESHCPDIFKQLNIDKIESKCGCFKIFIQEFDKKLNAE